MESYVPAPLGRVQHPRRTVSDVGFVASTSGEAERAAEPYHVPGLVQHSLTIEPTLAQRMSDLERSGRRLTPAVMARLMKELYRSLVEEQSHRFAEFFEHLLAGHEPVVFHGALRVK